MAGSMLTHCPSCGHESAEGMNFCTMCAAPLMEQCASCGFVNARGAAFCGKCAAPLASRARPSVADALREAERRQLTVMVCDLVGSTELSQRLDPEELREVVGAYQETCGDVLRTFDGNIVQYQGDGLLVYFGYPRAHEDDPARGIGAALAILDALPRLNAGLGERIPVVREHPLLVRIGVHTGPVVVGTMGSDPRREDFALGDTMNIAARLQGVSEPGCVVLSGATRHLVHDAFVLEDLGPRLLKGIAEPVPVWRALRVRDARGRPGRPATGLTPLVGREQELSLALDRWEQVSEGGRGQVVMLSGEAGMGKSRLVQALRERLTAAPHTWLECGCSPYHENSALHPLVECLEQGLLLGRDDPSEVTLAKLETALRPTGIGLAEGVPLFATLLSLALPERYAPLQQMTGEARRRKTLESVVAWLFALSEDRPVVLVVEDIHWIDPSSLELLKTLVEQVPTARMLLVLTFRPGVDVSWASRSHVVYLTLHPLTRKQVAAIVGRVTGGKALPEAVMEQVVAKTDGVPLFVEELTKAIVESDLLVERDRHFERADPLPRFMIPATLQDSLMARLDRLGRTKEVAQLAAVLGREFPYELLAAVSGMDAGSLVDALERLAEAELLYRRGTPPRATYTFKHALVQEAAYQSLLNRTRREYHARIARVLEERFPERGASEPEVLARHYEEARLPAEAARYYERAGERAEQRSANREAISHLRRGIELLGALPESANRDRQELRLQVKLGAPLLEARGYGDAEVERAYARARELCQGVGETPELFQALWGLSVFYHARNELSTAVEMGEDLLGVAERSGDSSLLISANLSLGCPFFWQAKFAECLQRVERTIALYEPAKHRSLSYVYGENPGVSSRIYAAMALWMLGFPDRALRRIYEAVEVARDATHPFSLGYALTFAAAIHVLRREREAAREWAEKAIALSEEQHLLLWLGAARFYLGWALAEPGAGREATEALEAGAAQVAATGTEVGAPSLFGLMAEAYGELGRLDDGLRTLENALDLAERRQSPFWNAELYRLKGELLLRQDAAAGSDAAAFFRRALEIARQQGAKVFELRASVNLSRLLRQQGSASDASAVLAPIYRWFTEGHGTADLTRARSLLDELS